MSGACAYSYRGRSGSARWSLEDGDFLLTPSGAPDLAFGIREVSGIKGNGDAIGLRLEEDTLDLTNLGGGGESLLDELRRTWLRARAEALRLTGSGEGRRFTGRVAEGEESVPFTGLLFEDVFLVAPEGEDARPLFLSLMSGVEWNEDDYTVTCPGWGGERWIFSGMGRATSELYDAILMYHAELSAETADVLARRLSSFGGSERVKVYGSWLPGRLLSLAELGKLSPGFPGAFSFSWLKSLPRKAEGESLMKAAGPGNTWLGFTRPGLDWNAFRHSGEVTAEEAEGPAGEADDDSVAAPAGAGSADILWMLVGIGESWLLEALSEGDHATYGFHSGPEMVSLASRLLCAPQFSGEALYLPLEALAVEWSDLSVAVRKVEFLSGLRSRFRGSILHTTRQSWLEQVIKHLSTGVRS